VSRVSIVISAPGNMQSCEVAIVGSGFAGSLLARVLTTLGYDVVLLERGTHPRFAIGESSTPLANLSLERIGVRYGLTDCYDLATHGRWMEHHPDLMRGLKRGFTYYRHHPHEKFENRGLESERLLVAASPNDSISDSHWMRSDIDHHFVREAVKAGVDYRDRVELTSADFQSESVILGGRRNGESFELRANFLVDASGPGGFIAKQLSIPSALEKTETRSALVFSHFAGAKLMSDVIPGMPEGPYPDDWAAVHHVIDEGWMYSLRFDNGVTSAGFTLSPNGVRSLQLTNDGSPESMWQMLLDRYPTIGDAFAGATPLMPIAYRSCIQHRLSRAAGDRWAMMPHAYAFVDPLFSTGIAWGLRAVERLALAFESKAATERVPDSETLERYDAALSVEADQIDLVVAGAYEAMAHFDLFAAQVMLYFAAVSFAEVSQRLSHDETVAWRGFLGTGDAVLAPLPRESLERLRRITLGRGSSGVDEERKEFAEWIKGSIAPRNIAGLANAARHNLYPVDFEELVEQHSLLDMSRKQVVDALPALRGMSKQRPFTIKTGTNNGPGYAKKSAEAAGKSKGDRR
jgi:FADH2 O2-dependent halogenase